MLTLQEAAQKAGVSDKTLRRAIGSGKLTAHQREVSGTHNNQPFMIAEQDLEAWIASRQVQASTPAQTSVNAPGLESRLADLEATVQRLQDDQLLGAGHDPLALGPADDAYTQNRIDDLKQRIDKLEQTTVSDQGYTHTRLDRYGQQITDTTIYVSKLEQTIIRMQEQADLDHKLAYSRIDVLEKRINELTVALQDTQDLLVKQPLSDQEIDKEIDRWMAKPGLQHLIEREKAKLAQTSTPAPDQETTFELADFSQLMLHEYRSSAVRGDVRAWLTLRPNPQTGSGVYSADYWSYDKADKTKKGTMSKVQKERGEQLKQDLKTAVLHALGQSGWKEIMYGVYACPDS